MTVMQVGIACVGVFVAFVAMFVISKQPVLNVKSFIALMGVIFGGVVLGFVTANIPKGNVSDIWYYPIGLVIGLIAWGGSRKLSGKDLGFQGLSLQQPSVSGP